MEDKFVNGLYSSDFQTGQISVLNELLLNTIQDFIFVVKVMEGPLFQYVYVNKRARAHARIFGDYYGKTFQELVSPELAEELTEMYGQAVNKRETLVFQDALKEPDGSVLYYESLLNPIFDASEACQYVVCITRDVTERVQEQEKLLESQMRYRSLFEYNSDCILSIDINGRIVYANPATDIVFGYKEEELYGQYISDAIPTESKQALHELFQQTLRGESLQIDSYKCHHRNGSELYIYVKTIPIIVHDEIKGVYFVARDITKQVMNEQKTEYYAYYDQLTGLLNRISFSKQLVERIESKQAFSMFLMDLDEFHIVNDLMSHECGDEVLKATAARLQAALPMGASIFRQHSDQFAILMTETNQKNVVQLAEGLLESMEPYFLVKGEEFRIGMSIGIVSYPRDGEDEHVLLKRADLALERAKEHERGYYTYYHSVMDEEREKRLILENQLTRAIERDEFCLYYQPQVNIVTKQITGLEALLRWNNRELGFVPPNYFIPLAERTGFISEIDEWVLREACRQLREWLDKGYNPVPVAINLSARQFRSLKIVDCILQVMKQYELPSYALVVEITEGALVHGTYAEQVLQMLKENGICIHLDDFGTGYSSLGYLKKYPIDTIKIDRAFIQEVNADERDAKITTAIIHLAHTLGMDVIAEGVEQAEQIQFLHQHNALLAQGYYFSKPLPVDELEEFCFFQNKKELE